MDGTWCPDPDTKNSRVGQAVSAVAWRCAALYCRSRMFWLLDEPTNHLDAESIELAGTAFKIIQRNSDSP